MYKILSICDNCGAESVRDASYPVQSHIPNDYARVSINMDSPQMSSGLKSDYLLCQKCLRGLKIVVPMKNVSVSRHWNPSVEERLLDIFRDLVEQVNRE